jgi:hypothetical protein
MVERRDTKALFSVIQYLPGGAVLNALARKAPNPLTASIFEWTLSSVMFMAFLSVNEYGVSNG